MQPVTTAIALIVPGQPGPVAYGVGVAKRSAKTYVDDVPDEVVERLRAICAELPDAYEEPAWVGVRWRVRKKTFAHVLAVDEEGADRRVVMTFRSDGDELEVLRNAGPPFYALGWSGNAMGMDLDVRTDWDEVRELVTDSFCVMAPDVRRPGQPAKSSARRRPLSTASSRASVRRPIVSPRRPLSIVTTCETLITDIFASPASPPSSDTLAGASARRAAPSDAGR